MNLALFDFDGTLTNKDSLFDFIQFSRGWPTFLFGLLWLSPMLITFKLGLISNQSAKERLLKHYFHHWSESSFKTIANEYALTRIDLIIRSDALSKLQWHQQQGDKIIIVSASIECWLKAWCDDKKIELLATQLEIKEQYLTGCFSTKNCFGIEKVNRLKQKYDLSQYETITAYGDSSGDKDMLAIANQAYYKVFKD